MFSYTVLMNVGLAVIVYGLVALGRQTGITYVRAFLVAVTVSIAVFAIPTSIAGQIFVTNNDTGIVGEYTTSGATVNASLITGLTRPSGIAVSGNKLFVANSTLGQGGVHENVIDREGGETGGKGAGSGLVGF